MFANNANFKKLPQENIGTIGENSPNLVTLIRCEARQANQVSSVITFSMPDVVCSSQVRAVFVRVRR
jgi:hypothetical protein